MSRTHCGSGYLEGIQKNRTTASIAAASAMMTIALRTLLRSLCAIYAFRADAEKKGVLLGRNATQYRDCFAGMPDILSYHCLAAGSVRTPRAQPGGSGTPLRMA